MSTQNWWKWKKDVFRPSTCTEKFATDYTFDDHDDSHQVKIDLTANIVVTVPPLHKNPSTDSTASTSVSRSHWCGACMRRAVEPFKLKCGHIFCKRCLCTLGTVLQDEYPDMLQDGRALIFCPLADCAKRQRCQEMMTCQQFVNGETRFRKVRLSDKMQLPNKYTNDDNSDYTIIPDSYEKSDLTAEYETTTENNDQTEYVKPTSGNDITRSDKLTATKSKNSKNVLDVNLEDHKPTASHDSVHSQTIHRQSRIFDRRITGTTSSMSYESINSLFGRKTKHSVSS